VRAPLGERARCFLADPARPAGPFDSLRNLYVLYGSMALSLGTWRG